MLIFDSLNQQMVLTLNRWIHQNKEQTEQVKLLVNTLKESEEQKEKEHQVLRQKLEAMTIEVLNFPLSVNKFYSINSNISFTFVDESSRVWLSRRTKKPIAGWSGKRSSQTNDSQVATGELGATKSPFSKFLMHFQSSIVAECVFIPWICFAEGFDLSWFEFPIW